MARRYTGTYVAPFALFATLALYAVEHEWPFAWLGFSAAVMIAAASDFFPDSCVLRTFALGFAAVASRWWDVRRRQDGHDSFATRFGIR